MQVLAYDVGGTRLKGALVTEGETLTVTAVPTTRADDAAEVFDRLVALGRQVAAGQRVDAVGVSVRGLVDPASGAVVDVNPPLACLVGEPLAGVLGAAFDAPVAVENDGRMYALGELRHGAARGAENVVCMTLGTGVGLGVVLDGRLVRGGSGARGILGGHFTIDVAGPRCGCGNVGCLETLVGEPALLGHVRGQLREGADSTLREGSLDARAIFAAALDGDAVALRARDRFAAALGAGVVTAIHAYDPELVVFGGGLSLSAEAFLPAVREYVSTHAWTHPRGRVRMAVSELGDAAALLGAFELAHDESGSQRGSTM